MDKFQIFVITAGVWLFAAYQKVWNTIPVIKTWLSLRMGIVAQEIWNAVPLISKLLSSKTVIAAFMFLVGYASKEIVPSFVIQPVREQFQLIKKIKADFQDYARVGLPRRREDSDEKQQAKADEAMRVLRKYSNELRASTEMIRWYRLFELLSLVPNRECVESAWKSLMALSNAIYGGDPGKNMEKCKQIEAALRY